jgi:predicted alpha/beta hydrolase family esterase
MGSEMRLLLVPCWAGTPSSDFYPWLRAQLAAVHPRLFASVEALDMPEPQTPVVQAWVDAIVQRIGTDAALAHRTLLLGHSVGCQAVLRAVAALPQSLAVHGVLGVAGWWSVDQPWPTLVPWIETPFDHARARAAGGHIHVLVSTDDPYTADHEATRRLFVERLGAHVRVVDGARHFNRAEEPAVLQALTALAATA